jgi:alkylation response protein AidB-like acyl-CoA dehydrogenase
MDEVIERPSSVHASKPSRPGVDEAVEQARRLAPAIRARAGAAERARAISPETIAELEAAGLLDLARPAMFGGAELGFAALMAVVAEISAACGSTGWVYSVFVGHDWMLASFPEAAQREVFGRRGNLVSSVVHFGGPQPTRVAGGFRFADGTGRLCSGVDHAAWVLLGTSVAAEGATAAEARYFLVPKSEFEIVDDWHTAGLRGTGSKSIRLAGAFVPEYRSVSIAELAKGKAPGLSLHDSIVYRAPFPEVLVLALTGAPLGIARGALARHAEGLRAQFAAFSDEQLAEQGPALARVARASAQIDAAFTVIRTAAARVDASADPLGFNRLERASLLRDYAYAAQAARSAVNDLFEGGGSRAIYDSAELQRSWRDMNTACAHIGFQWDRTAPTFARAFLDLPPGKFEVRRGH